MEQNEYSYTRKIGKTTYRITLRQSPDAQGTVYDKVKKLILADYEKEFMENGV